MSISQFHALPVLLVDDDPNILKTFQFALKVMGITNIICCQDGRGVPGILNKQDVELMVLDLTMPHVSGLEMLKQVSVEHPDMPVIVVTGANDVKTAVECMKAGAHDYLVKPIEAQLLVACVRRAIELRELRRENERLRDNLCRTNVECPEAFSSIKTQDGTMLRLFQYTETVARSRRPVLITGETGVGKELFARAIHQSSECAGPFVPVNVAGLDDNVFSDTLFGHVKGSFTGAEGDRRGLIESAANGVLFLDEIGDLALSSQVKLLRLLQENEYFPIGADLPRKSLTRMVLATNRDLQALQQEGKFRKDLFFRLSAHRIHIPPLRERFDDLPLLVDSFVSAAAALMGMKPPVMREELYTLLKTYSFPGNVRELENLVFDAVNRQRGPVLALSSFRKYLGKNTEEGFSVGADEESRQPAELLPGLDRLPTLRDAAQMLIDEAMSRADGNQAIAAQLLGISRTSLNKRLRRRAQTCEK